MYRFDHMIVQAQDLGSLPIFSSFLGFYFIEASMILRLTTESLPIISSSSFYYSLGLGLSLIIIYFVGLETGSSSFY